MGRQKTLFDFIDEKEQKVEIKREKKIIEERREIREEKREEELVQKLIELFEHHMKCLTKEEVVAAIGISKHRAIKLLNELSQIGVIRKRLNDNGELVYCPSKRE